MRLHSNWASSCQLGYGGGHLKGILWKAWTRWADWICTCFLHIPVTWTGENVLRRWRSPFSFPQVWKNVPENERRDIYEDAVFHLSKREKEDEKALRKRNMKNLTRVLDSMTDVTYRTVWTEAQQLLLDNPTFSEDTDLLGEFSRSRYVFLVWHF